MKAEDLRIGNWVMGNKPFQLTFNDFGRIHAHLMATGQMRFEPIHLTEDWLVRFGFEIEKTGVMNIKWPIKTTLKETNWGRVHPDFRIKQVGENYFIRLDIVNNQINYLHQLQNLFYYICGKELTIK